MNSKTLLVCAMAAALMSACGGSNQKNNGNQEAQAASGMAAPIKATNQLNIYNWSDYVDPDSVKAFGEQNKVQVTEAYYDSNEMLEAKLLTGKSGYDLVAPSLSNVGRQIKAGAYQPIDKSQIPNYNNIDPELLKLMAQVDESNQYAVPYFWGINTLAINKDLVIKALSLIHI